MKKLLFSFLLVFVAGTVYGQNVEVKTNPIGFAFGATNLSVEVPLPAKRNVTLNASGWHYSKELRDWTDTERISIDFFGGAGRILIKQAGGEYNAPAEWIAGFNFGYRF